MMWFVEYALMPLLIGTVTMFWAATKHLAVVLDRPDVWDGADLGGGVLGAVAMIPTQMLVVAVDQSVATPVWLLATRRAAMMLWGLTLLFWMGSIWIETETAFGVPESLRPINERCWDVHLGWIPGAEEGSADG
jgi:hypothetical protein